MYNKSLVAHTDDWFVCENNFIPEIRNQLHIAKKVKVTDCTLRDGEQQAGVVFTSSDKVAIAKQLDKLGVAEIEIGTPASSDEDKIAAKEIVNLNMSNAKPTALARCMKDDIDLLCNLGIWGANISYPIGDLQRKYKLKVSDEQYLTNVLTITEYAKKKGLHVNLSPYDTTRCNMEFLTKAMKTFHDCGFIDRVRLVDSVGSTIPQAMTYYVQTLKSILKEIPLEIHVHNDFGMAIANTVAAVCAGADVVSSTMNGVGERSGNVATEEVAVMLQILYGVDLGIDMSLLKETSDLVQKLSGVKIAQNKAVVGKNCFAHESGLAVAGMRHMPFTSEAYAPHLVGQESRIVLGKKSGRASIDIMMTKFGFEHNEDDEKAILKQVKEYSINNKKAVENDVFVEMCKAYFNNK